jgi:hypothetical protein
LAHRAENTVLCPVSRIAVRHASERLVVSR